MLKVAFIFCLFFSTSAHSLSCDETQAKKTLNSIQWYTEDYPPYHYIDEQAKLAGIYPEILTLIYKELNLNINIKEISIVPWARLLYTLESSPKHAAFSMIETSDRKNKFQLVPLPLISKVTIMVLNENKDILTKKSFQELTYSVVRADIGEQLLEKQLSIKNKVQTTSATSMLNMLIHRRIDAIAYTELVAHFQLNKMEYTKQRLVSIHTLSDTLQGNFAFHKSTPKCVSTLFSQTIASLDKKGEIAQVMKKYHH